MSDDSLDMPEFDKPENIPLVVPDVPFKKQRKLRADHCEGTKKDGGVCGFAKQNGKRFCIQHDPDITADQKQAWRKVPRKPRIAPMGMQAQKATFYSREEILEILSKRIRVWMKQFGELINPDVDEAICNLARTYAAVARVEVAEGAGEVRGWRMKGAI